MAESSSGLVDVSLGESLGRYVWGGLFTWTLPEERWRGAYVRW